MVTPESVVHTINKKSHKIISTYSMSSLIKDHYDIIRMMHSNQHWLQCDCMPEGVLMYPRLLGSTYSLVNHPKKGKHNAYCKLYTESSEETLGNAKPVKRPKLFMTTSLLGSNVASHSAIADIRAKGQGNKQTKIHQFITHALIDANLNKVSFGKVQKLTSLYFTDMFKLKVGQGSHKANLAVKDITKVDPTSIQEIRLHENSIIKRAHLFKDNIPIHANFIMVVDDVLIDQDICRFVLNSERLVIRSNVSTHMFQRTKGPRLMFITKVYLNSQWHCHSVYTHPIYSKPQPIFVDSNIEREFVHEILKHKHHDIVIEKFLHPVAYLKEYLLPDFKVTHYNGEGRPPAVIAEVMGMLNNEDYVLRKERLVPLFAKRFKLPVVEVEQGNIITHCSNIIRSLKASD